jgi:hypothetical protein
MRSLCRKLAILARKRISRARPHVDMLPMRVRRESRVLVGFVLTCDLSCSAESYAFQDVSLEEFATVEGPHHVDGLEISNTIRVIALATGLRSLAADDLVSTVQQNFFRFEEFEASGQYGTLIPDDYDDGIEKQTTAGIDGDSADLDFGLMASDYHSAFDIPGVHLHTNDQYIATHDFASTASEETTALPASTLDNLQMCSLREGDSG